MLWGLKTEVGEMVGYKQAWCNQCDCQRLANQFKQKTRLTLFWIPTIPVTSESVWRCSVCDENPQKVTGLSKIKDVVLLILAVAAIIVLFFSVVGYFSDIEEPFAPFYGVLGLGYLLYLVRHIVERKNPIHEVGNPNQVIPASQINCHYCQGILETRPKLHCPSCKLNVDI